MPMTETDELLNVVDAREARIVDLESAHTRLRAALERLADVCPVTPATLPALDEACAVLLETAK